MSYYFLMIFWEKWPETPALVKSNVFLSVLTLLDLSITYPLDHSLFRYSLWGWLSFQSLIPSARLVLLFSPGWPHQCSEESFSFLLQYLNVFINWLLLLHSLLSLMALPFTLPSKIFNRSLKIVFYSISSSHSKSYQVLLGLPPENLLYLSFLHSCCFLSLGLHSFSLTRLFSVLPQLKIIPLLPYTVLHS